MLIVKDDGKTMVVMSISFTYLFFKLVLPDAMNSLIMDHETLRFR